MTAIFLSIITSFILCFLIIPVIIKYSQRSKILVDQPGRRKIHKRITPSMGGIAIFLGFIISFFTWSPLEGTINHIYTIAALFIVFLLGLRDDIITLKPINKLLGQLIGASIIFFLTGIKLAGLYGLFGIYSFPDWGAFLLTAFTIIVVTNSFILIDGLDGLAGTIAAITLAFFGIYFSLIDQMALAVLNFSMLGAVIAFLIYNWEPSRIFMGDTGALSLGFFFAIMVIYFINYNYTVPDSSKLNFNASITTAVCVVIIPLLDTLRIFILRIFKGRSPFAPDKKHLHHTIMKLGLNHSGTTLILVFINLIFIGIAILFNDLTDSILLPIVVGVGILISVIIDHLMIRRLKSKNILKTNAQETRV